MIINWYFNKTDNSSSSCIFSWKRCFPRGLQRTRLLSSVNSRVNMSRVNSGWMVLCNKQFNSILTQREREFPGFKRKCIRRAHVWVASTTACNSVGEYSKWDKTRLLVQRKRRALKEKTKSIKDGSSQVLVWKTGRSRVQKYFGITWWEFKNALVIYSMAICFYHITRTSLFIGNVNPHLIPFP